ncbi:unnamed protein product, partial [Mesorhabditis belari]|uniref:non-specific serine/threonine protein kinase n=1 Tax=Mesorhabditis belari TaxID=2138241 RepID=A0AAF3EB71_9BILA
MPKPFQESKPGNLKDPTVASLFSAKDPELRFDDLREIGHGSFGAVYYAFDKESGETVAVKKMAFSGKQGHEKWNDIIKEVSFLQKINHPNIVQYKSCFLKDQTCWLIMEYCIGSAADIVDVLRKGLLESEIAAICAQTLDALGYLHGLNRIHRDVKAGNILLTDFGVVKLADFGSASVVSPAQTFIGTPFFMAPEVILAMDEGQYTEKADVWSLGITCIELAERRPPLFNMNAMSALYHIAQNDPPTLQPTENGETTPWSETFVSFIEQCLKKDPEERLNTTACMNHKFIKTPRSPKTIVELISRTKELVLELDNFQYRKMRKLMYLDQNKDIDESGEPSNPITESTSPLISAGSRASVPIGGTDSPDSNSNSNSLASYSSVRSSAGKSTSKKQRAGIPEVFWFPNVPPKEEQISDENRSLTTATPTSAISESPQILTDLRMLTPASNAPRRSPPPQFEFNIKDEMMTLRRSKFSTLRTTKVIAREHEDYLRDNNFAEQMSSYKRLRQVHHKELRQLEDRCKTELDVLHQKQEREMDQLNSNYAKERQKVQNGRTTEMDKRRKEYEEIERKLRKQISTRHQHELKSFAAAQLKEYKFNKEQERHRLKQQGSQFGNFEQQMKSAKDQLNKIKIDHERRFEKTLVGELEEEMRKHRRASLIRLHGHEERMGNEEMAIRERQMDSMHALLRNHHRQTTLIEEKQMQEIHNMKTRHQDIQHEAERGNQENYTRRLKEELRRKHAQQSKQQPKEIKAKEAQIRKQYRQAVKTQTRQFKIYHTQMLQSANALETKELTQKLKDDQKRRISLLTSQYESQIFNMVHEKTVKLDAEQEEEARLLDEKLANEERELKEYQARQKSQLSVQIQKEMDQLAERIALRLARLEQKVKENKEKHFALFRESETSRQERQKRQLQELDAAAGTSTAL